MKRKLADENDISDLSEYERIRLKNIEERQQKLLSLGIVVNAPGGPTKKARILVKSPSSSKTTATPVRFSTRLRGIKADNVSKDSEPVLENVEEKIKTIPRRDLGLNELLSLELKSEQLEERESSLKTFLNSFTSSLKLKRNEETKLNLSTLKINENGACKVIPSRITSMAFHSSLNQLILSVGDKLGNLSIWNLNDREQVHSFNLHDRNLNCMSFDQHDSTKLITTSYDGTVRQFDMRLMKFRLLFGTDESFTSYHSQVDCHQYLVTLGKGGDVGLLDLRKEKNILASKIKVFSNGTYAKTVSYKDGLFVCGNSKSECLIYDLRKSDKPYLKLIGHKGSVSSAFFNPSSVVPEILTTDYKDKIRLYNLSKTKSNDSPTWSLTHNNFTGRWLTPFKALWHPTQPYIFVGSMSSPRQLDVFDSKGNTAKTLTGEWLTSTASVVIPHPYANIVAGGNSSGKVFIFEE